MFSSINKKEFNRSKSGSIAAAAACSKEQIDMHINRRQLGEDKKLFILGTCAQNGLITEPESEILTGQSGYLNHLAKLGFLIKIDLPAGLKSAPHFPHLHYYQLTEKGYLFVSVHKPYMAGYRNQSLHQRTYLHDFIARIEAAWRIRLLLIAGYIPEIGLSVLRSSFQKIHDGHFVLHSGAQIGLEVEAQDCKSGDKLARFASQIFNSIENKRVDGVLILVQNDAAKNHYSKPFESGQEYFSEWVMQSGKWVPRQSSLVEISPELAAKVKVVLIRTKAQIKAAMAKPEPIWMPSALVEIEENTVLYAAGMLESKGANRDVSILEEYYKTKYLPN
jgi:hypothetical protein